MPSEERDTRIPYRLGTNDYCKFEGRNEYVHMGDLVAVDGDRIFGKTYGYCGYLCGVGYDGDGFICSVSLNFYDKFSSYFIDFDRKFLHAEEVKDD